MDLLVPAVADACAVDVIDPSGYPERFAGRIDDSEADSTWLAALRPRADVPRSATRAALETRSTHVSELTLDLIERITTNDDDAARMAGTGIRWWIVVPLGEVGLLHFGHLPARGRPTEEVLEFLTAIGERAAAALAHRQLVAELQRSRRRFERILDVLGEAVTVRDANGRVVYENEAARALGDDVNGLPSTTTTLDEGEQLTVTVVAELDELTARLARAGFVAAEEEAAELLAAGGDLEALVARRLTGEPLAWITGTAPFCGLSIRVDPGVYVPRWQTEALAWRAVERLPADGVAIDLCTGSGAIAKVLMTHRPGARVIASDVDERAVACARSNGVRGLRGRPVRAAAARASPTSSSASCPYVPTPDLPLLQRDTFTFETPLAYDGGADGLDFVRRVIAEAPAFLRPGGALLLELGGDQAAALDGARRDPSTRRATCAASNFALDTFPYRNMIVAVARAATTTDAFNAVAEPRRRQILDVLAGGERPVNDLVAELGLAQPQVSKHLRVLREVGAVDVRDEGRQRLYRLNGHALKPIHDWVQRYEATWAERFDELDVVLEELKNEGARRWR